LNPRTLDPLLAMSFAFPSHVYPIVDTLGDRKLSPVALAQAMLDAGVRFLQLRVKDEPARRFVEIARAVKAVTDGYHARLIINDRADIAKLIDAAGVHLGQDDLPPRAAREILGPNTIIGFSTHNVAQAEAAAREGFADYIGFGPIYPTTSKERADPVQGLEGLRLVRSHVKLPIVAIGGIAAGTMRDVLAAGADAVAMIGEIVRAEDVSAKVRALLRDVPAPVAGG
jgi:thiamine-phosphate pyrophosphorylase